MIKTKTQIDALEKLRECRSGITHDDEVYSNLNCDEHIKKIRPQIHIQDAPWLLRMLSSPSSIQRKFALDLTKPLANEAPVKEMLNKMWRTETAQAVMQSLLFAFLNVEDLTPEQYTEAFEWIEAHQSDFNESVLRWYGGKEAILDTVKLRANDPSFTKRKHWIYLCCAIASDRKAEAQQFITSLPGDNSELMERVRKYALTQLDGKLTFSAS